RGRGKAPPPNLPHKGGGVRQCTWHDAARHPPPCGEGWGGGGPTRRTFSMILFPAIDLKDGKCVRLKLGDMDQATIFNDSPAAQARSFEDQGFEYLHVVDLNGAFAGESVNGAAVEDILRTVKFPVQLGGGIRTLAHIESWLGKGLS